MRKNNPGRANDLGPQRHIIPLTKRDAKIAPWLMTAKMAGESGCAISRDQISAKTFRLECVLDSA
jgi:hypothetical protein